MVATPSHPKPTNAPVVKRAKLFMNGRSQAVRLPKEFRFEGTEVEVERDALTGSVTLSQPVAQSTGSWQELFDRLDALDLPDDIFEREVHMPTERDLF